MAFYQANLEGGKAERVAPHNALRQDNGISSLQRRAQTDDSRELAIMRYGNTIDLLFMRLAANSSMHPITVASKRALIGTFGEGEEISKSESIRVENALTKEEMIKGISIASEVTREEAEKQLNTVQKALQDRFKAYGFLVKKGEELASFPLSSSRHNAARVFSIAAEIAKRYGFGERKYETQPAERAYKLFLETGDKEKAEAVKEKHKLSIL